LIPLTETGQQVIAAEPVRTKRAKAYVLPDSDALALVKRNSDWAHIVDIDHPFDRRPNTWLIRHGDIPWNVPMSSQAEKYSAFMIATSPHLGKHQISAFCHRNR
jgi:hypothetical protein